MHKEIRICPICGRMLNIKEGHLECSKCGEHFVYDSKCRVWRNPNIIDISYADPNSAVLSTLFPHKFTLKTAYGMKKYNSIAGFLLTICWPGADIGIYDELARLSGLDAVKARTVLPNWRETQSVTWNRKVIGRNSNEYQEMLKYVFDEVFEQSHLFRLAIMKSRGKILMNVDGETDRSKTLITSEEFLSLLNRQRDKIIL